jgi:predicted AlkP superfamily pyrophosphatase or phosphodiesterase
MNKTFLSHCAALLPLLCFILLAGPARAKPSTNTTPPPLVLISLDGFRWDYCLKHPDETPNLRKLISAGVTAQRLIPVFPSNTFPNHYSIVTGLYPAHHGIINNYMTDASTGDVFFYKSARSVHDAQWWGGEPIWITAVRQGRKSACYFWVGSEAENHGLRPTFWQPYDYSIPFAQRLETVIGWLRLPVGEKPAVIAFYFEETNSAGHTYGPDSPESAAAVKLLDGHIGTMVDRLRIENLPVNFVIVSDHGMIDTGMQRVMILEDCIDLASVQVDFTGSVAGLRPLDGDTATLLAKLTRLPHARVYRTEELPAGLHMATTSRTPTVWILPQEGWHLLRRAEFEKMRNRYLKGDHGYDPSLPSMGALFIAQGPSFKEGVTIEAVENIHIYNLLCAALGLIPAPNDGDDRLVRAVLRE